jgi:hypothetical protein
MRMKTTTCKDSMIYTVILYCVILNLVLAVLIHFCQLQYFISKNILIFVKGFLYELFIKIHVTPVVVAVATVDIVVYLGSCPQSTETVQTT